MKDPNDKNTIDAIGVLYRCTFTHVIANGRLRNSAIVLRAASPEAAKALALAELSNTFDQVRVSNAKIY